MHHHGSRTAADAPQPDGKHGGNESEGRHAEVFRPLGQRIPVQGHPQVVPVEARDHPAPQPFQAYPQGGPRQRRRGAGRHVAHGPLLPGAPAFRGRKLRVRQREPFRTEPGSHHQAPDAGKQAPVKKNQRDVAERAHLIDPPQGNAEKHDSACPSVQKIRQTAALPFAPGAVPQGRQQGQKRYPDAAAPVHRNKGTGHKRPGKGGQQEGGPQGEGARGGSWNGMHRGIGEKTKSFQRKRRSGILPHADSFLQQKRLQNSVKCGNS